MLLPLHQVACFFVFFAVQAIVGYSNGKLLINRHAGSYCVNSWHLYEFNLGTTNPKIMLHLPIRALFYRVWQLEYENSDDGSVTIYFK